MADTGGTIGDLTRFGVVPVVVVDDPDVSAPLGEALVAGGLPIAEVTLRTAGAVAAMQRLATVPDLLVGAGTVLRADQVDQAVEVGARFVVSPGVSEAVIRRCRDLDVLCLPGVATATEIMSALDLGLDTLKFFPAEAAGGLATLRALAGPFPDVWFVPTGGIGAESARDYLDEPSVLAVGGSWMVPRSALRDGDWDDVTARVAAAVRIGAGDEQEPSRSGGRDATDGAVT